MSKNCLTQDLVKPRWWVSVLCMKSSRFNNCFPLCLLLPAQTNGPQISSEDCQPRRQHSQIPVCFFLLQTFKFLLDIILCPQLEFRNIGRTSLRHPRLATQALTFLPFLLWLPISTGHSGFMFWFRGKSRKQPISTHHGYRWIHGWAPCFSRTGNLGLLWQFWKNTCHLGPWMS